jgi:glycosyltransferase involved in cell wall biosynthesis
VISVITTAYNEENHIRKYFDSLLNQTYRDLEINVVDNGSADGTWDIIQEYAARDPRVKPVHLVKNQGPAAARNIGLDRMTGDYFACIDADDWMELECLEQAHEAAVQQDADMVMWGYQKEYADGTSEPQKAPPLAPGLYAGEGCRQLQLDSICRMGRQIDGVMWTRLTRSSIVKDHGLRFEPSLHIYDDTLFALEIHFYCSRVFSMGDRMYLHYRQNEHSVTHSYLPNRFDTVFRFFHMLREFLKANDAYTQEVKTRIDWSCLFQLTKAVKNERFHDVSDEEKIKAVDAILTDPRVRDVVAQVGDGIGEQLLGERYTFLRDQRSWDLLNAAHL